MAINAETEKAISDSFAGKKNEILAQIGSKNANYFEVELDKLDKWGEDKRNSLRLTLKELDDEIKEIKKQARLAPNLPEKLKLEKEKRQLESKRDEAWREYDSAAKEIENKKDGLIDEIEKKLKQKISEEKLFTIRWKIV
jgi:predicted  nucleic acid-binding Zn-ribbon protein